MPGLVPQGQPTLSTSAQSSVAEDEPDQRASEAASLKALGFVVGWRSTSHRPRAVSRRRRPLGGRAVPLGPGRKRRDRRPAQAGAQAWRKRILSRASRRTRLRLPRFATDANVASGVGHYYYFGFSTGGAGGPTRAQPSRPPEPIPSRPRLRRLEPNGAVRYPQPRPITRTDLYARNSMGASGRAGKRHSSRAQLDGALQDRCGNSALCPGLVALKPLSVYLEPRRPHGVVAPVLIHDPGAEPSTPVKQDPGPMAERSKTLGTCNSAGQRTRSE